ncbi:hypothetical protein [Nocardioides sp.]|uniref:hypothetical protein n=1 Tax=Nocardioides sp. TaxID=35761 RepID=UPI002B8A1DEA|nr:hypothetical protein [Nocardioides sp.]HXH77295.1 hypothetical protein [Nocardioides sp.]
MTTLHRCPICRAKHAAPRVHRAVRAVLLAIIFSAIEIIAALALDGWISIALWLIAAWNALRFVFLVWGLATLAVGDDQ